MCCDDAGIMKVFTRRRYGSHIRGSDLFLGLGVFFEWCACLVGMSQEKCHTDIEYGCVPRRGGWYWRSRNRMECMSVELLLTVVIDSAR